ncbi:single-stranded DNA-binding protein [Sulfolobales archaeon HS-7]|nr:single-stranded DNA-binding protein [Sulfolobales archaeon HS-7]
MEEKVGNLKPNMSNINVKVRVLEAGEQREITTRNGVRTISEATVGDETGRTKLTLWGKLAGSIQAGKVIVIENAWTSVFRNQVNLNAGNTSKISEADGDAFPSESEIPQNSPEAPEGYRPQRRNFRGRGRGYRRHNEGEDE